jgi:hypothetical protein
VRTMLFELRCLNFVVGTSLLFLIENYDLVITK